jgi:hypothetical protein
LNDWLGRTAATAFAPVDNVHCPISIAVVDVATDASFNAKDASKKPEPIFVARYECPAYRAAKNRVLPKKLTPGISVVMLLQSSVYLRLVTVGVKVLVLKLRHNLLAAP